MEVKLPSVSVDVRRGVTLLHADGLYGPSSKVASYAPRGLNKLLAPFVMNDLTVCSSVRTLKVHVLWVLYALLLMLIIGQPWAYPDTERGQPSCPGGAINKRACQLEETFDAARQEFRFLIVCTCRVLNSWHTAWCPFIPL